jgi:hypothetical protein
MRAILPSPVSGLIGAKEVSSDIRMGRRYPLSKSFPFCISYFHPREVWQCLGAGVDLKNRQRPREGY